MANGFIRIPRTFFETDIWSTGHELTPVEAFMDLARRINFDSRPVTRTIGGREVTYGRDEVCLSVSYLVKAWNWSTKKVRTFLQRLEREHLICLIRTGKGCANIIRLLFTDAQQWTPEAMDATEDLNRLSAPADRTGSVRLRAQPDGERTDIREGERMDSVNALTFTGMDPTTEAIRGERKGIRPGEPMGYKVKKKIKQENKNTPSVKERVEKNESTACAVSGDALPLTEKVMFVANKEPGTVPASALAPSDVLGNNGYDSAAMPNSELASSVLGNDGYGATTRPASALAPSSPNGNDGYGAADTVPGASGIPTLAEIEAYCAQAGLHNINPLSFFHYYNARGWRIGQTVMRSWKSALHRWTLTERPHPAPSSTSAPTDTTSSAAPSLASRALDAYREHCEHFRT